MWPEAGRADLLFDQVSPIKVKKKERKKENIHLYFFSVLL